MRKLIYIEGSNFSGRSEHLGAWLMEERKRGPVVYVGPSIASSLTGLARTVSAELALYKSWDAHEPPVVWQDYFKHKSQQLLASLSGGEQVLLALIGTGRDDVNGIAIDCALEQLDNRWREWAIDYLKGGKAFSVVKFADNRVPSEDRQFENTIRMSSEPNLYPVSLQSPDDGWFSETAKADLIVEGMTYCYNKGSCVFKNTSFSLSSGRIYRLCGPTGSGKTTLIRLLCGVLPIQEGIMYLNGKQYQPFKEGNRLIALSMQNPDDQWTDISMLGDFRRRVRCVNNLDRLDPTIAEPVLFKLAQMLGVADHLHKHILDFPRVLRKRLSWIWPLSGFLPWLVFDEPTLGQDDATIEVFAKVLLSYAEKGYGIIYVAHDHRLPILLPGTDLAVGDGKIVLGN